MIKLIHRAINVTSLMLSSIAVAAAPTVTGSLISWPDDGWYQVQQVTSVGVVEACQGGRSCEVSPGNYIVVNHSTGERFEDVVVNDSATSASPITVSGNTVSWPDDGWYQVLNESNYEEVCAGGRSCELASGSYLVINHSTNLRFEGIVVGDVAGTTTSVEVNGSTISWPDDGWYQVLDQNNYSQVCGGTRSCDVTTGLYTVINHSTGMRWEDINVGGSMDSLAQVSFDITVPAYQSDELMVKLAWFDREFSALWNVDELWTAVDDFPINSEESLTVTFYDRNGSIVLGRFEQMFNTGADSFLSVVINADQFFTGFDEDSDGVSNLDELIAGSDPLLAETRDLPIRDSVALGAWATVLPSFESIDRIDERPYLFDEIRPEGSYEFSPTRSTARTVSIDESGNASFYAREQFNSVDFQFIEEKVGTRTSTGSSILWVGSDYSFSESHEYSRDIQFSVEASRVDAQRLRIAASYDTEWLNTPRIGEFLQRSYDLIVVDVEGGRDCLPDSGRYISTTTIPSEGYSLSTTLTKNLGDEYWHVLTTRNDETTSEYWVRWVNMAVFCNYRVFD